MLSIGMMRIVNGVSEDVALEKVRHGTRMSFDLA